VDHHLSVPGYPLGSFRPERERKINNSKQSYTYKTQWAEARIGRVLHIKGINRKKKERDLGKGYDPTVGEATTTTIKTKTTTITPKETASTSKFHTYPLCDETKKNLTKATKPYNSHARESKNWSENIFTQN